MGGGGVQGDETPWWARPTVLALLMGALWAAVLGASYLKMDLTRNDFERFDDLRLSFLFFALFGALCGVYFSLYWHRREISRRTIVVTTAVCAALLLATFPVGSKDVFGYAVLGRLWGSYHANPYLVPPTAFRDDPWQAQVSGLLTRPMSVYGPLFLWQAWLLNACAGESFWTAVWLHKVWAAGMFIGSLWIADALGRRNASPAAPASWLFALFALNPLFLFETAGDAHNDIAMTLLLLAALLCWRRQQFMAALTLISMAFWYKWYSVIFLPAFLIETMKASGLRPAARQAIWWSAITAGIGVVVLISVPGSLPTIVRELLHPQKMAGIFPNELSPPLAALFWGLRALGAFDTDWGFRLFDVGRFTLCGAALLATFGRQLRVAEGDSLAESCFLIGLAFFFLLISQLWPWHLLPVVAFGVIAGREPFVLAAVLVTLLAMLSNFLTFAVATVMVATIPAALWLLRRGNRRGATGLTGSAA